MLNSTQICCGHKPTFALLPASAHSPSPPLLPAKQHILVNDEQTAMSSVAARTLVAGIRPFGASWQQTMLRIRDPAASLKFYTELLGFSLIHKYDFPDSKFSLYFLATLPKVGVEAAQHLKKQEKQRLLGVCMCVYVRMCVCK